MNKKFLSASLAGLLLLTGCSTVSTTVPESSEKLMTIGNVSYTKGDEYQLIKRVSGPDLTIQQAKAKIAQAELSGEDFQKQAEDLYAEYEAQNPDFEKSLKSYGYDGKQAYIDTVLIPSLQSNALMEKYFQDAKEEIQAEYKPVLAAVIEYDSEDNAKKALEALKEGTDPGKVAAQYGKEGGTYTGVEQIFTTNTSTIPVRLQNALQESSSDGVLDEIFQTDTSTDNITYYTAKIISRDYNENVKQIASALGNDSKVIAACTVFYLKKYDFQVHDQYIFDYYKANNPEYLVTRPDLSEDK